ncbi:Transducin/WD40 repeat superfamily protein [Trifolium repens]|nr:Transducin/WD40 repeat superfamily protein [Trifolium repens]
MFHNRLIKPVRARVEVLIISNNYLTSLGAKPLSFSRINSFDINPTRPYSILVGGEDSFARLFDTRNSQSVQYFCPKHLSTLGVKCKKINHVAFSSDGSEALINYQRENLYLINMKQETLKNLVNKEYGAKVYEPEEYGVEEVEELLKSMNELKVSDSDSNESVYEHVSPRGSERGSSEMSEEKSERGSSEMSEKDSERGCNEMSEEDSDLYLKDVVDKAFDTRQRFVGHLNLDYLTQEAKFIGREGEYIACGSADDMLYIYHKCTGKLMHRLFGNTYGISRFFLLDLD